MKREEKEEHVKLLAEELGKQHLDKLNLNDSQYRKMIVTGTHCSKDVPPQVPLIVGTTPKKPKQNAFEETILNTAS